MVRFREKEIAKEKFYEYFTNSKYLIGIVNWKNIELKGLPVYDDRYMKTKIRTLGDKVYANFCGLNVPEDDIECKCFTVVSIDSLLVYENKYYLQIYLDNCAYKTVNKHMADYLDENLFEN